MLAPGDIKIWARNGQRDAWEACATADVDYAGSFRHNIADHGTVEKMALPQARDFARAYKTTNGPVCSERIVVSLREWQTGAKYFRRVQIGH